ncbi:DEAD/DEAH box helicase family protein [Marivirga sp. S37H4]|uniref:DEAD/DEAH box helicase family protein n=1 Tax=Marivirga aurantiaca TaxID=2802615 RepID=A0A935CDV4_9BACT|nr:DEAD/DEAH box helicase family protein [Marivirga aurantiaca]
MNLLNHQQKAIETLLPLIEKRLRLNAVMVNGSGSNRTLANLIFEYCRKNSFNKRVLLLTKRSVLASQLRKSIDDVFRSAG